MDPMEMASAMMAFQRQAAEQIPACRAELEAAGHGFSDEDRAAIAESAAAHPFPAGYDPNAPASPEMVAQTEAVAQKAMSAEYPKDGFPADDPRVQPIEGVSMPLYAIASKAIGWNTDPAFGQRIAAALGVDPEVWARVSAGWNARVADDVVLGAFFGQLFNAA
jgi:hypothetical protein